MRKSAKDVLAELRSDPRFFSHVTSWRHIPSTAGEYMPIPPECHPSLAKVIRDRGVKQLYSHQREAYDGLRKGNNVCVVTPTASGKTLCYNLTVLDTILKDPESRALYIFPTKALAQDQLAEIQAMNSAGQLGLRCFTFDGDTPSQKRRLAKEVGQIIITNPDMLHQAILPHHPTWVKLFSALRYVIIDEMHGYRGVFGSHVANVLERLKRIAAFYGSKPQFILASATIANPGELASALVGEKVQVIAKSGAPTSEKDFVFYNPPLLTSDGSVRQSAIDASYKIAQRFIAAGVQTIVFARSRVAVELLVQYMRNSYKEPLQKHRIQGYRGGYLPNERRAIEKGLREGDIVGVAATNALELGIDIGNLDCSILAGYPGSISSTWQQAGRAGRRTGGSVSILVAGMSPLDQFIVENPDYFFHQSAEYGLISPENPYILGEHVKCASYELPFKVNRQGTHVYMGQDVSPILEGLEDRGILHRSRDRWNWSSESFPAAGVNLRSASAENFVVIDTSGATRRVIGEVDWFSAPLLIHDEAIYLHGGEQYHVLKLDYQAKKAYVKRVNVDYYTDANLAVGVKVISIDKEETGSPISQRFGEVSVTAVATIFKKIKLYTHENVGSGQIALPETNMHTQGTWFSLPDNVVSSLDPRSVGAVLSGLASVISNLAPLFLMCDRRDLGCAVEVRSTLDGRSTVYFYDSYPGGVGLAERVYDLFPDLFRTAKDLLDSCKCQDGCPGCVGPVHEAGTGTKDLCRMVLERLIEGD
ncbi:MAG: DEAD/DEAH box helicase [Bacillota bacterium]|jgi:DEAD/DEAH box helicase domain-containing protein